MKSLKALLTLALLATAPTTSALASSGPVLQADLSQAPLLHRQHKPFKKAHVTVDLSAMQVSLVISINSKYDERSELPITSTINADACGSRRYIAQGERHADGSRLTLTVVDNTGNRCRRLSALPATEVNYELERSEDGSKDPVISTFTGESLN